MRRDWRHGMQSIWRYMDFSRSAHSHYLVINLQFPSAIQKVAQPFNFIIFWKFTHLLKKMNITFTCLIVSNT